MYTNRNDAKRAVIELNYYEIRKGEMLGFCLSIDNYGLFIGGIAKTKSKDEIMLEVLKVTDGVSDVIVYPRVVDKVRILYVRNLMLHTTEDAVRDHFNRTINSLNAVEPVKKIS
ncbi:RNA-binding protein 47 [Schistosoma japonicum]|nr:RNA-binding protein 47 [Schistosoma japonicum]